MRRLAPYILLSLLLVGAAAGAALGTVQGSSTSSPSQWVADALAATEMAGSAHFSYISVTSSPNPDLRGSSTGHGEVDFSTDDVRVTEVDRNISFSSTGDQPLHPVSSTSTMMAIVIGGTDYQAFSIPGLAMTARYSKLPFPTLPRAQRGLPLALDASVALDTLRGPNPVASVTDLGPDDVGGVPTTQYEVDYAPLHVCVPHQTAQVLTQRPSRVWLDSADRIIRVRSTLYFNDNSSGRQKLPAALADVPRGPVTTVATLTFDEYGVPVRVSAPPKSALLTTSGTSFSIGTAKSHTCNS